MRVLLQRVKSASVSVDTDEVASIKQGLLVFLGVESVDNIADADWLVQKITRLRIFPDEKGNMNVSINDIGGEILVVSQFTLHASTKKGNRPSFVRAAAPAQAEKLYHYFIQSLRQSFSGKIAEGRFGAMMDVTLVNNGPVTIWMDSREG